MADTELESLSVKLKGDASPYERMLRDSQQATRSFSSEIMSTLGGMMNGSVGIFQGLASAASSAVSGLVTAAADGIKGVAGAIPFVGSAISGVVGAVGGLASTIVGMLGSAIGGILNVGVGFVQWFRSATDEILDMDAQARQLGVSLDVLQAAMHWSGNARAMPDLLDKLSTKLVQARMGSHMAAQDFLALARVSGGPAATNFAQVIDQLSAIPDPANRAAMAFRVLGSNAKDVLAALSRPGGLPESRRFLSGLGMGAGDADLANLRAVQQAMRDLEMVWKGVMNQVLLAIAPIVRALSEAFDPRNINIGWIRGAVTGIIEGLGMFVAFLVESTRDVRLFFDALRIGFNLAEAGFRKLASGVLTDVSDSAKKAFLPLAYGLIDIPSRVVNPWANRFRNQPLILPSEAASQRIDRTAEQRRLQGQRQADADFAAARAEFDQLRNRVEQTDSGRWMRGIVKSSREFKDNIVGAAERLERANIRWIEEGMRLVNELQKQAVTPEGRFREEIDKLNALGGFRADLDKLFIGQDDAGRYFSRERDWFRGVLRREPPPGTPERKFGADVDERVRAMMREREREGRPIPPDLLRMRPGLAEFTAFRSFQALQSGLDMQGAPQLAGVAEFRSREAFSAEAQFRLLQERGTVEDQIRNLLLAGNEQRQVQNDIGREILRVYREVLELMRGGGAVP